MNSKNIIELNGKRYDALTGKMLAAAPQPKPAAHHTPNRNSAAGHVLDGVSRHPTTTPSSLSPHRLPAHQVTHHIPERSKTLMRTAVKKPGLSASKPWQPAGNTSATQSTGKSPEETPGSHYNLLGSAINPLRAQRAKAVQKSGHISKYGSVATDSLPAATKTELLHVRPAPSAHPRPGHVPAASAAAPDPFKHALQHAHSHQQPAHKRPKLHHRTARKLGLTSRALSVVSGSLAILLLTGFFAYQNMPNLAMRVAARQAGFSATLPDYRPAGFTMRRSIQHQPGQVTISFRSNSDDRSYSVTQRASNLNSDALLDNFQASGSRSYQTFQDKGKTIYVYDDSNATWVSGGVLYEIAGDSALSNDQLLRIAASL